MRFVLIGCLLFPLAPTAAADVAEPRSDEHGDAGPQAAATALAAVRGEEGVVAFVAKERAESRETLLVALRLPLAVEGAGEARRREREMGVRLPIREAWVRAVLSVRRGAELRWRVRVLIGADILAAW